MKEKVKLLISGLPENSGPGDLLGAMANDTRIDGKEVGRIDIKGSVATLSIPSGAADSVIANLDEVSGRPVTVARARSKNLKSHLLGLARLVEMEREEEMRRHEREIRNLTGFQREKEGRAILHLKGKDKGTGLGGKYLIKFVRQRPGEQLPDTEITVGDLVMLSRGNPLKANNPTGTVSSKTNYSLTIAFDRKPRRFLFGKGLRCDLYVNDITYQRQLEALKEVTSRDQSRDLASKALGQDGLEFEDQGNLQILNKNLNTSQIEAVRKALAANDFYLIHGPPGTGKTVTCIEAARQLIRRGEKVLCTADSNTAVDNLVERLADWGENVVRVGHPARVTPNLRSHTLDEIIQNDPSYIQSQEAREAALKLVDEQGKLTHPGGRWRRGMSNGKILALARRGKGSRGVPPSRIKEMAKWIHLKSKIDDLFNKAQRLEEEAISHVLEWADVICATNSGSGSELMSDREFNTVIIDEATQATEPSCWIPMVRANKVVMAGDHKQLPPTILSPDAEGLSKTLFESLVEVHGNRCRSMLKIQYRMHEKIMQFSNQQFYDDLLEADESVASHTILDLLPDSKVRSPSDSLESPLVFVDTRHIDGNERTRTGSTSKENPVEAEIVDFITSQILDLGILQRDIAVISPYDDQVDLLRRLIGMEEIEIDTVDGFQGREKEVVIVSLVRSNSRNSIGFLNDIRRLNVALTRAKRKLIIIGDSSTITSHQTYEHLLEYVRSTGKVISLEEPPKASAR